MMNRQIVIVSLLFAIWPVVSHAREKMRATTLALFVAGISSQATAEAIEYVCTFAVRASEEGLEPTENLKFSLTLDSLTGDAFMTGNNGVSQVFTHRQGDTVTFLRVTTHVWMPASVQVISERFECVIGCGHV